LLRVSFLAGRSPRRQIVSAKKLRELKFPVIAGKFPVPAKKIPCSGLLRELGCNGLKMLHKLARKSVLGTESGKIPC